MNINIKAKVSFFFLLTLLLLISVFCGGCMSPQERNGVSLLPQNRPLMNSGNTRPLSSMGMSF